MFVVKCSYSVKMQKNKKILEFHRSKLITAYIRLLWSFSLCA